eukprot:10570791-Ditylum_brightwellii.AAC.1
MAYWSKKLSAVQRNYTTMEKELLSIVFCFKEYRSMLLGADITNAQYSKSPMLAAILGRIQPKIFYFPGKDNVLANCFLRLPRMDKPLEGKRAPNCGTVIAFEDLHVPHQSDELYSYTAQYSPAH